MDPAFSFLRKRVCIAILVPLLSLASFSFAAQQQNSRNNNNTNRNRGVPPAVQALLEASMREALNRSNKTNNILTNQLTTAVLELINQTAFQKKSGGADNPARFAGVFTGDGLSVQSEGNPGRYSGVIKIGQTTYDFTARELDEQLSGVFESATGQFDFKATLDGDQMTLVSGDSRYQLTREGKSNSKNKVNDIAKTLLETLTRATSQSQPGTSSGGSGYTGKFSGDGLVLDSKESNGQFSGTLSQDQNAYNFAAQQSNGQLQGLYETKDGRFEFSASIAGDTMTLVSGESRYQLVRQTAPNAQVTDLAAALIDLLSRKNSGQVESGRDARAPGNQAATPAFNPASPSFAGTSPGAGPTAPSYGAPPDNSVPPAINPVPQPSNTSGRFKGRFAGNGLTLDSQESDGRYIGTITLGQSSFNFSARENGDQLAGVFESNGDQFDFTATLRNDGLTLLSGETRYDLVRENSAVATARRNPLNNPLANSPAVNSDISRDSGQGYRPQTSLARGSGGIANSPLQRGRVTGTDSVAAPNNWRNTYRHDSGFSLRYPDNWQVREDATLRAAVFVTDDTPRTGGETIMVSGADAGGVTTPSDPLVLQNIDAIVVQMNPAMKRSGRPESFQAGSRSAVQFTWDAKDLFGGQSRIRVYTTVLGQAVVSLTVFGPRDRVNSRDAIARQILATFNLGESAGPVPASDGTSRLDAGGGKQGGLDSRLVGTWWKMDYKAVGNSSWEKYTYATLRADGTANVLEQSGSAHNFQYKDGGGNETGRAGGGSSNSGGVRARWRTTASNLILSYESGSSDSYRYEIRPNSSGWPILRLQPPGGGKVEEWSKK